MIKYKLSCKNCEISFDSWFASSKEYEKLKKKDLLNCHLCNSRQVEKSLMAPKFINKPISKSFDNQNLKLKKITNKIKEYQKFIKNNFDFVGKILHMRQDPFITMVKKRTKVSMERRQKKKLKNLRKKVSKQK